MEADRQDGKGEKAGDAQADEAQRTELALFFGNDNRGLDRRGGVVDRLGGLGVGIRAIEIRRRGRGIAGARFIVLVSHQNTSAGTPRRTVVRKSRTRPRP